MKKIIFTMIGVLLITLAMTFTVYAAEEIFDDPSFEKTREDLPDWPKDENWMIWRKNTLEQGSFIDNTVARTGKNSIKIRHITNTNETYVMHIMELEKLSENTDYLFSGYAKAESLVPKQGTNGGAALIIEYKKGGPSGQKVFVTDNGFRIHGTCDWTKLETLFNIKEGKEAGADTIVISAVLKTAKGTAWFDDMSLIPVKKKVVQETKPQSDSKKNAEETGVKGDTTKDTNTSKSEKENQNTAQSETSESTQETAAGNEHVEITASTQEGTQKIVEEKINGEKAEDESTNETSSSPGAGSPNNGTIIIGAAIAGVLFVACGLAIFAIRKKKTR